MNSKKWYLSKTIWTGIVTMIIGGLYSIDVSFGTHITATPLFGFAVSTLGALGIYTRATATTTITK